MDCLWWNIPSKSYGYGVNEDAERQDYGSMQDQDEESVRERMSMAVAAAKPWPWRVLGTCRGTSCGSCFDLGKILAGARKISYLELVLTT